MPASAADVPLTGPTQGLADKGAGPGGPMPIPGDGGEVQVTAGGRLSVSAFLHNKQALIGLGTIVLIALFCFAGPFLYHTNQGVSGLNLNNENLPPGAGHPLGTDASGYDILGRLMLGGQSSLELGFAVAIATTVVGTLYGAIAGLVPGWADAIMMRVVDTLLAVPVLVLLLILVNIVTPTLGTIILLLSAFSWLGLSRLVRGEVLGQRTREFVLASRMMGGSTWRILSRHMLRNTVGVVVVSATFTVSDSILGLSTLSFLGLGLPPPEADWGSMLSNGLNYLYDGYWWMVYPPAVILIITIIAFRLVGDALRDSLDTRLRRR
jgi:peptide/nickel transport system permease protein